MERPIIKDKGALAYVEYLENRLKVYEQSPYVSSYLSLAQTIDNWNKQLFEHQINILNVEDKPKFEMAHKFLTEQKPYIEQLEYLRKLMTPEEQREIAKKKSIENVGVAEKMAMNGKH